MKQVRNMKYSQLLDLGADLHSVLTPHKGGMLEAYQPSPSPHIPGVSVRAFHRDPLLCHVRLMFCSSTVIGESAPELWQTLKSTLNNLPRKKKIIIRYNFRKKTQ